MSPACSKNSLRRRVRRFVILSGCSGGGKSTLLEELRRRGHTVVEEPGRRIVREEMPEGEALPWRDPVKFAERLVAMARADLANATEPQMGWTFFDRGLIDALVAHTHVTKTPLTRPPETHLFNRLAFLTPPWREIYRIDSERQHSFEEAIAEYDRLLAAFPALGFEPIILPKTDVEARADFVCEALATRSASS
ncbi:MAG TPA: AAA family ATPase [Vitreimonas sp.]|nr:AAA family ATPase [Vitreimonas sp.]